MYCGELSETCWLNFYHQIRKIFGFNYIQDYKAAEIANMLISEDLENVLENKISGKTVAIIGAGPNLENLKERPNEEVIIAADGASNYLANKLGILPDIVVTDLDGIEKFYRGILYIIHAHGDNIHLLLRLGRLDNAVVTAQVEPFGKLKLYGGFTDGDRAVVIAYRFGASRIRIYGMDFESGLVGKYSKPYLREHTPA
ncbi:MAG: 6-hydroxymethylpterin diphosphokinase MptE-like protein, partial [Sulfolobaceae archaeon]